MQSTVAILGRSIASLIARVPFPTFLGRALQYIATRTRQAHRYAPLVVALIASYAAAELTLWAARQPLYFLWPVFGWLSGNDVDRLSLYNVAAHILAFIVAAKVVFEMSPLD
jgi:hypothetical protein